MGWVYNESWLTRLQPKKPVLMAEKKQQKLHLKMIDLVKWCTNFLFNQLLANF